MEKPDEAVQSWRNHVAYGVGILFSLFHCWNAYAGTFPGQQLTTIHLTGTLIIGFLLKPAWQGRRALEAGFSAVLAALALITGVYLFNAYNTYSSRAGMPTTLDVVLGWVLILIVLEGARRCLGNGLVVLAAVFLVYMGVGPYLPDVLSHRGFSPTEIAEVMFLSTDGIHGTPLQISAKFVVMFIIFGALLQTSGGGQFILDLPASLFGRVRGGPAKVAVLASSLFGTISGSAPANVMAVGWLTIPLMKRMGATSLYAAAVEAVASTGGQIMPPVMGAAAFLMADFLSMSYAKICIAAAIPAVLYYVALYFLLDFEAIKQGWTKEAIQATITDSRVRLSWTGVLHLVPVAVLFRVPLGRFPGLDAVGDDARPQHAQVAGAQARRAELHRGQQPGVLDPVEDALGDHRPARVAGLLPLEVPLHPGVELLPVDGRLVEDAGHVPLVRLEQLREQVLDDDLVGAAPRGAPDRGLQGAGGGGRQLADERLGFDAHGWPSFLVAFFRRAGRRGSGSRRSGRPARSCGPAGWYRAPRARGAGSRRGAARAPRRGRRSASRGRWRRRGA